jgi:hypothetical protein
MAPKLNVLDPGHLLCVAIVFGIYLPIFKTFVGLPFRQNKEFLFVSKVAIIVRQFSGHL